MKDKSLVKTILTCLALVLVTIPLMIACTAEEPVTQTTTKTATVTSTETIKPIVLSFQGLPAAKNRQFDEGVAPWIAEVEKRTGGKVKIEASFMGQLCPAPDTYNAVTSGLLDIGSVYCTITPGRFSTLEVMGMPMLDAAPKRLSSVAWELYETFPEMQQQFNEAKLIGVYAASLPYQGCIGTVDRPVRTLEDMKGLKMTGSGKYPVMTLETLGAVPMQMNPADYYVNLQKKIIDAAKISTQMLELFKLKEVIKYVTLVSTGFTPLWMSMNMDTWNSLPADVQKVFEETGGYWYADLWDDYQMVYGIECMESAEAAGVEMIYLSDAEMARWVALTEPIQQMYADDLNAAGLPGTELVAKTKELMVKYSK